MERLYGKINWSVEGEEEYREFKDAAEARAWGKMYYQEWGERYVQVMRKFQDIRGCTYGMPIESYCGYSYRQINKFLRNDIDNGIKQFREMSDILTLVLCSAPRIPCKVILYRMVSCEFVERLIAYNKQEKTTPIQEKGFMSTSLLKDIANQNESYANDGIMLKIYVEQGTIGLYVNAITYRSEEEMLLCPNLYLGLANYPYRDKESGKIIYECKLLG